TARYGKTAPSQFVGAEMIAQKWNLSREEMDVFGLESNARALRAIAEGRFNNEVVPFAGLAMDETARQSSLEKMATLKPIMEGGRLTAGNSSQMSDAASALLVCSEAALKRYNLK